MEKLKEKLQLCRSALATFTETLELPFSVIVRDASIQRFEYTFESVWKALKSYLELYEGIVCYSPKGCFREALQAGLLSAQEAETCLVMTDDRNLTAHTYMEALAEAIHRRLPSYAVLMGELVRRMQARLDAPPPSDKPG